MLRRGAVAAAALTSVGLLATSVAPVVAAEKPRRFMSGWLPYWSTEVATSSFLTNSEVFSDISPFWHDARFKDDRVYIYNHLDDASRKSAMAKLRGQGVKILPSITDGTGKGNMAATLKSKSRRAAHVEEIVSLVLDNGYDGIDLDYETFAFTDGSSTWSATRPNWVRFVHQLSAALHAEGKLLAVTIPPSDTSISDYWVYDYEAMGKHADLVRIMAYDYSVSSPGPIAPISWVREVASAAAAAMPDEKVQLGIPVYGRNWFTGKTGKCPVDKEINDSNYAMTAAGALSSLARDGVSPSLITRDASGELTVSYSITYRGLSAKGKPVTCTVSRRAFFADDRSVADRVRVARKAGLGGAALWTIGGEASDQWPAVRKAVGKQKDSPGSLKVASVAVAGPKFVTRGQQGSFSAEVAVDGKPSKGGTATLQMNPMGPRGWRNVASQAVPASGRVLFSFAPKKSGSFRVAVSGTGERAAARSTAVKARVRAAVDVRSSIVAFTGQKVRLQGQIAPARKGVTLYRQRLVDGSWKTFGRTTSKAGGNYSFRVIPTVKGAAYTYRVVSKPFEGYARGYSSTVSFRSR